MTTSVTDDPPVALEDQMSQSVMQDKVWGSNSGIVAVSSMDRPHCCNLLSYLRQNAWRYRELAIESGDVKTTAALRVPAREWIRTTPLYVAVLARKTNLEIAERDDKEIPW